MVKLTAVAIGLQAHHAAESRPGRESAAYTIVHVVHSSALVRMHKKLQLQPDEGGVQVRWENTSGSSVQLRTMGHASGTGSAAAGEDAETAVSESERGLA